jgi:hypothetical protein
MTVIPAPAAEAIARVRAYLAAMEARDLPAASAMLAPGFAMVFPGNNRFTALAELVAWAKPRYRFVRKLYQRFDAAPAQDGVAVTCFGTLQGEWPDGTAFSGVRFCDWFLVGADGRLVRQEVWNDLAELARAG